MGNGNFDPKTRAVQLSVEALFKLLGGTPEDRLRFWEFKKGITSRAENELVNHQIETIAGQLKQVALSAKALQKTAGTIAKQ